MNRIGFFIQDARCLDYYQNVWSVMEKGTFVALLNDISAPLATAQVAQEKLVELGIDCEWAGDWLKQGKVCKLVVGVGNGPVVCHSAMDMLAYVYAVTLGRLVQKSGIAWRSEKLFGRDCTLSYMRMRVERLPLFPGCRGRLKRLFQRDRMTCVEALLGYRSALFPKGMDSGPGNPPQVRLNSFDEILAHSQYDYNLLRERTKKPIHVIGYPRYDGYDKIGKDRLGALRQELGLDEGRHTVLWMTSSLTWPEDRDDNVRIWASTMLVLASRWQLIFRPHPMQYANKPSYFDDLAKSGMNIDRHASRKLVELYALADIVLCDHGGSIFSALYCNRRVVLLNHPEMDRFKSPLDLDMQMRAHLPSVTYSPHEDNAARIDAILNDAKLWEAQSEVCANLRETLFGDVQTGDSSHRTAALLRRMASS